MLKNDLNEFEAKIKAWATKKDIVFGSVVSVFQDIGYAISNADLQTGLVFAESSTESDNLSAFFGIAKVNHTKATAFIERIGDRTKVRLNFVEVTNTSSSYGQNKKQDRPLLDAKLYQNAHEKIYTFTDNKLIIQYLTQKINIVKNF